MKQILEELTVEQVDSRTSWQETKKIQIKLAATFDKNEQQQDAKNNNKLYEGWSFNSGNYLFTTDTK